MNFKSILTLVILLSISELYANVAQPGLWGAGGMGNFSLLYPEDSLSYKKIQMVDEKITIQLYKGYAVVKGVYRMLNDTKDTVKIKTGYPLNSDYESPTNSSKLAQIRFDSLYGLDVKINSVPVTIISEPKDMQSGYSENDNWYVWQNVFPPGDTTVITVYFIVNTNNNYVRKGYSKEHSNGFIYVLETGSTWKQPIVNGEIRIKLEDNLKIEDIKGLSPDSVFKIDKNNNLMQYKFSNKSPVFDDNVILTYSENIEDLNFPEILSAKDNLYQSIDSFSETELNPSDLKAKKFESPYKVDSEVSGIVIFILTFIGVPLLIIIIFLIILIFLVIWIVKRIKKKRIN